MLIRNFLEVWRAGRVQWAVTNTLPSHVSFLWRGLSPGFLRVQLQEDPWCGSNLDPAQRTNSAGTWTAPHSYIRLEMWLTCPKSVFYRVTKHPRRSAKKHLWQCPALFPMKSSFRGSIPRTQSHFSKLSSGTSLAPHRKRNMKYEICWTYPKSPTLIQIETHSYLPKLNTFLQFRFSSMTWSMPCQ